MTKNAVSHWSFRLALLGFSLIVSQVWAAPPPPAALNSAHMRHYLVGVSGGAKGDFVYLDKAASALVSCKEGDAKRCKNFATTAIDFVPLMSPTSLDTEFLLIDASGNPQVCSINTDAAQLSCRNESLAKIGQNGRIPSRGSSNGTLFRFPHSEGSVDCGSRNGYSLNCSQVKIVQPQAGFLVGRFTSTTNDQNISLRGSKAEICETGALLSQCRSITGLETTKVGEARYGAAKLLPDGRFAVFSVRATNFDVCVAGFSSGSAEVQFQCSQGAFEADHSAMAAYVVPSRAPRGRDRVLFADVLGQQKAAGAKRLAAVAEPTAAEPPAHMVPADILERDAAAIRDLATQLGRSISSGIDTKNIDKGLRDSTLKTLGYDDDENSNEQYPEFLSFWNDTDN